MSKMMTRLAGVAAALLLPTLALAAEAPPPGACYNGAYALADGSRFVIQPGDAPNLRWRMLDGTSGKLFPTGEGTYEGGDGWSVRTPVTVKVDFGACGADNVRFQRGAAPAVEGRRIAQPTTPITFASGDQTLYGELVMPASGKARAVVVLQYGSDKESAVANNFVQHLLPLKDIAVFVFDKRGTGRSTGAFTANFDIMADDMTAAVRAVRARPEARRLPLGVMGESQGGWVVPIVARKVKVDFVVVSYGLAVSIIEEDRSEVAQSLAAYGPEVQAQGQALHDAATKVVLSGMSEGVEDFERLKAASAGAPWRKGLGGDYTSLLAGLPPGGIGEVKWLAGLGFQLDYNPVPTLEDLRVPTLWVLAGKDTSAPHELTLNILRGLQATGSPIDVVVFPNADHGIIAVDAAGKRLGGAAPGYFDLLGDWITTRRLTKPYGDGVQYKRR